MTAGSIWGFNFARTFRGREYTQWTRAYGHNVMNPDHFRLQATPIPLENQCDS